MEIPLLALLLALAAFFASSETALFSLSRLQRRRLEKDGDARGRLAARLLEDPRGLLSSILLGNTFAQVALAAVAADVALATLDSWGWAIAVSAVGATAALLLAGEVAPKVIAASSPMTFSRLVARPLSLSRRALELAVRPLERTCHLAADMLVGTAVHRTPGMGTAGAGRLDMVDHVVKFEETLARQVMTPRVDILAGDLDWPAQETRHFVRKARASRLPFYRENLDNIEGVLAVKPWLLGGAGELGPFLQPPYFVPEGKRIHDLFRDFERKGIEMAIVLDEHGQTVGLVTLEDVFEELFGEVYDESDKEQEDIVALGDGAWRVQGRAQLDDVESELGLPLEADEGIDTLGGLVMNYLGEIPRKGDSFIFSNHTFTISKVTRHRVQEVVIQRLTSLRDSGSRAAARPPEA